MKKTTYETPAVELLEIRAEQGFATSVSSPENGIESLKKKITNGKPTNDDEHEKYENNSGLRLRRAGSLLRRKE